MNYYKHHIGDYAKKTGRLSLLQHGAYRVLLDSCYDREVFPTMEEAIDWTWASSAAEIEAVEFVLRKFFTLIDGRYVQQQVKEDIAEYQAKAQTNARIAHDRETTRREKGTNRARVVDGSSEDRNESSPNHKPITKNQEPKEQGAPEAGEQVGPDGPAHAVFAEQAAKAMKTAGLVDVSASHPKLKALVSAGLTVDELAEAARVAAAVGKGFPWALARAEGQRRDAAHVGALPDAAPAVDPDSRSAVEADGERFGLGRWQQLDAQGQAVPWSVYAGRVKAARASRQGMAA